MLDHQWDSLKDMQGFTQVSWPVNLRLPIIIIIKWPTSTKLQAWRYDKQVMTANGVYSVLNVPRKATAFPLWRAIESCWNKNMDSLRGSSVTAVIRWPISWINSMARWFHALAVSIATGKKMWVYASSPYSAILLTAALLALLNRTVPSCH